jgi:hypothetical protein
MGFTPGPDGVLEVFGSIVRTKSPVLNVQRAGLGFGYE